MRASSLRAFVAVSMLAMALVGARARADEATATPAPTEVGERVEYVFSWPAPSPTEQQVADALDCNVGMVEAERYSESLAVDDLRDAYEPATACDWAALAAAYAKRNERGAPLPGAAQDAFIEAVTANPVLAFSVSLMAAGYPDAISLVEPPPQTIQAITAAEITYAWSGIGNVVNYSLTITDADTEPVVSGWLDERGGWDADEEGETATPEGKTAVAGTVDVELVQALGPALTNLLPVNEPFTVMPCWDLYPDWVVTLTFADGSTLELVTNQSNFILAGGPWQTTIDGQPYAQYSAAFLIAVAQIHESLGLPWGQTAAYGCGDMDDADIIRMAFLGEPED